MKHIDYANFDDYLSRTFGPDLEALHNHDEAPTFLRVNLQRTTPEALAHTLLERYGIHTRPHPAHRMILEVTEQPPEHTPGTCLPHFLGHYAIQSLGSMLPPILLDPQPGEHVVDLCAAPGSKASQIATMLGERGYLYANELSGKRLSALAGALDATGVCNTSIVNTPGERLPFHTNLTFDAVLADVPCTGLGRREHLPPNRKRFEKRGGPTRLPDIQYGLLLSAAKLLKPGGRLLYSTCSLTVEENEGVLQMIFDRLPLELIDIPALPGITMREGRTRHEHLAFHPHTARARRITPWENPTDGFFVALMRKTGPLDERFLTKSATSTPITTTLSAEHPDIAPLLQKLHATHGIPLDALTPHRFLLHKQRLFLQPLDTPDLWSHAIRHGLPLATWRNGTWRLSHSAIQRFGEQITRNRVDLDPEQMGPFIRDAAVELRPDQLPPTPYPAVSGPGLPPFVMGRMKGTSTLTWKQPRRYDWPES